MKSVKIVVKDGKIIIDFNGFIGNECFVEHEKIQQLLKNLGIEYIDRKDQIKPEAYRVTIQQFRQVKTG